MHRLEPFRGSAHLSSIVGLELLSGDRCPRPCFEAVPVHARYLVIGLVLQNPEAASIVRYRDATLVSDKTCTVLVRLDPNA